MTTKMLCAPICVVSSGSCVGSHRLAPEFCLSQTVVKARGKKKKLWVYGTSDNEKYVKDHSFEDSNYVLEPFLEAELDLLQWTQILATLDVCVNEVHPIKFCDRKAMILYPFVW